MNVGMRMTLFRISFATLPPNVTSLERMEADAPFACCWRWRGCSSTVATCVRASTEATTPATDVFLRLLQLRLLYTRGRRRPDGRTFRSNEISSMKNGCTYANSGWFWVISACCEVWHYTVAFRCFGDGFAFETEWCQRKLERLLSACSFACNLWNLLMFHDLHPPCILLCLFEPDAKATALSSARIATALIVRLPE